MKFLASSLALLLATLVSVSSHRPAINGASCGDDYGSSTEALPLPDPTISWAFRHYLDCTHRAIWIDFENPSADQQFYVGVGIPPRDRFADIRADALVIGPGLPALSADQLASLPEQVVNDPIWTDNPDYGAYYHVSPQDQSTCDHLGTVMQGESSVVDGRCNFFEPFGQTNSWRVLDADNNTLPVQGATYYVAVFLQEHVSSKISIALGTWVEDFITQYDLDTPSCSRDLSDFSEKNGLQPDCFPVVSCPAEEPVGCVSDDSSTGQPVCELGQTCDESSETPCTVAGVEYESPAMGACGGELCPAAVQSWEEINMKMHMGMMDLEYTGDADIDFVRGMIPHHIGAVDMCRVLIEDLTCSSVEDIDNLEGLVHLCNHIQIEQEIEVGGMRRWLEQKNIAERAPCSSQDTAVSRQGGNDMNGMMMMPESCGELNTPASEGFVMLNHKMHALMAIDYSCNHSVDFVRMMMPHHASAVDMCDIVLETTEDDYLIELCDNITLTQRAEISWMYDWMQARDYEITASCEDCQEVTTMMEEPCEDTLSTSSFCHGISGASRDGYCRCDETFVANNFTCGEPAWVEGFGLFMPEEFCARTCGICPDNMRPLWIPGCFDEMEHNDMDVDHSGHDHGDMEDMDSMDDMTDGMDDAASASGSSSRSTIVMMLPALVAMVSFVAL